MGGLSNIKKILLLTYGCNLVHSNINYLVKDRLSPFEIEWGNIPKNVDGKRNVLFQYDVYDANIENNNKVSDIYFHQYLISENHLNAFEYSLSKLNKGMNTCCHLDARGHIEIEIDHIEYSARTLIPIDKKTIIILLDEEAEANAFIRFQLHLLPAELQYLIVDYKLSYDEQKFKMKRWIQQILLMCK